MSSKRGEAEDPTLAWVARVSMLGTRFFYGDMLRWAVLTGGLCSVVLIVVFQLTPDAGAVGPVLLYVWMILGVMFVFSLLIALVVFRNRYYAAYRLTAKGLHYELVGATGRLGKAVSAGDIALGLLTASAQATAAGLLAASGRAIDVTWSGVKRVIEYPGPRVISIRNGWRTLFRLHCHDDQSYARIAAFVQDRMAKARA